MHWSVGMLLHAVCVLFFKGGKNRISLRNWPGVSPNTFSSQHGAADLDSIPFISSLDVIAFVLKHDPCFAVKQVTGYVPLSS